MDWDLNNKPAQIKAGLKIVATTSGTRFRSANAKKGRFDIQRS